MRPTLSPGHCTEVETRTYRSDVTGPGSLSWRAQCDTRPLSPEMTEEVNLEEGARLGLSLWASGEDLQGAGQPGPRGAQHSHQRQGARGLMVPSAAVTLTKPLAPSQMPSVVVHQGLGQWGSAGRKGENRPRACGQEGLWCVSVHCDCASTMKSSCLRLPES